MKLIDIAMIAVIAVIIGLSLWYLYRAKKSGKKCIGCPDSCACSRHNCSGGCQNCQEK